MDEAMRRRARMTLKFTQLRESFASDNERQHMEEHMADCEVAGDDSGCGVLAADGVPNWVDALAHCLTGGVAGVLANAIIFPIDVAKTRMQVEMPIFPAGVRGLALVRSFYQGLVLGALETGAVHASSFLFYDYLKGWWIRRRLGRGLEPGEETPRVPIGTHLFLGVIASLGTQHVTLPLKVLLIRIQGGSNTGLLDAARAVVAETGIGGFWAGSRATLWMATNPSVTYVVYERLKRSFSDRNRCSRFAQGCEGQEENPGEENAVKESKATASQNFLAGFIAKAVATVCTFPVQKTQAMVQARPAEFNGSQLAAIRSILFSDGPSSNWTASAGASSSVAPHPRSGSLSLSLGNVFGLWRGLLPKLMQAALQQALIFRIKEILTKPTLVAVHRWYRRRIRRGARPESTELRN